LQFETFRVGEFAHGRGNGCPLGKFRSAVTPRSGHQFKETVLAVRQRPDEDGLQDAMLADHSAWLAVLRGGNYMAYKNNRLRFNKLVMDHVDLILIDMDPAGPPSILLCGRSGREFPT
jgi:hypothetical protein